MKAATVVVSAVECKDHPSDGACRYQVAWAINPHMSIGSVDFATAARQHQSFRHALEHAGAEVIELPFVHGAYDSVFSKDPALLLERGGVRRALLARLRHPERQVEQAARASFFECHGFDVVCESSGPAWEGGDVVMLPSGRGLLLGHGPRTCREATRWLERHAGVPVVPLALRVPQLYHLDLALTVLPDGTALVCPQALSADSLRALERTEGIDEVVPVALDDALAFGLNLLPLGDTLVSGARVPAVAALVRSRGFRLVVTPLDQFHLAGGGAACLAAQLHSEGEIQWTSMARSSARSSCRYGKDACGGGR